MLFTGTNENASVNKRNGSHELPNWPTGQLARTTNLTVRRKLHCQWEGKGKPHNK